MSQSENHDLQFRIDRALVHGFNKEVERYLVDQDWSEDDMKKLAYATKFWRDAAKSTTEKERMTCIETFIALLSAHRGLKIVLPMRLWASVPDDTASFIAERVVRKAMGKELFHHDDFKNFRYEVKAPHVQMCEISGCKNSIKYIVPKGVVVNFEDKILYLMGRTSKVQMFFSDPKTNTARRDAIKKMEDSWSDVSVESVAIPVHYDEANKFYTKSSKMVLKQYMPAKRWKTFEKEIEIATKIFEAQNKKLLNQGEQSERQKLRNAFDQLQLYCKDSNNEVFVNYEEPKKSINDVIEVESDAEMSDGSL
ncbi:hypothetical protein Q7P35_002286 [Cladosporium inversicolor]